MTGAGAITCGVDIGARTVGILLWDGADVAGSLVTDTGPRPRQTAERAFAEALEAAGVSGRDIARTLATGYGRNHFPHADGTASEIVCQATGVAHLFPRAGLVVDIGGQDSKVIRTAPGGKVLDFAMNDRCAAGTGRFIEMVAGILGLTLEEAGELAVAGDNRDNASGDGGRETCEITSTCAVFAESEIVGLLQAGSETGAVLRGVYRSVARRTVSLMGADPVDTERLVFTGGVARNAGVVQALREALRPTLSITVCEVLVPENPQTTGALGAAIVAARGV